MDQPITVVSLREKKEKLKKLLQMQELLQKRKVELARHRSGKSTIDSVNLTEIKDEDSQKIYKQIYPILCEIHKEEIRIKELKDQIEQSSINKEINSLRNAVQQVCQQCDKDGIQTGSNLSQLYTWAKELKQETFEDGTVITDVHHISNPTKTSRNTERLTFILCHQDFPVAVNIEVHKISFPSGTPPEVKTTSDPYLPGLEDVTQNALVQHLPVKQVLQHLVSSLNTEIIPFL